MAQADQKTQEEESEFASKYPYAQTKKADS
jgi:hypothetical protein